MRIRVLPDEVVNCIAAGEVVERPASVVRELVDNAIDAGADEITVYLEGGGRSVIRVVDNGSGMVKADALLAFERHATSKITSVDDLATVHTLGFRGEALSSVAAVSRVRLLTRTKDSPLGVEVRIEGGVIREVRETQARPGTEVEVRALFFNTPARRKFLRSEPVEERRITEWIRELALAHPSVRFRVVADGVDRIVLARRERTLDRARDLYEGDFQPLDHTVEGSYRVEGLVGHPRLSRQDSRAFAYLVNGRVVTDRMLSRAVREGYGSMLKPGESPLGFVALWVEGDRVDLNVHPQKQEVRFREEREVYALVAEQVREGLRGFRGPVAVVFPVNAAPVAAPELPADPLFRAVAEPLPFTVRREEQRSLPASGSSAAVRSDISPFELREEPQPRNDGWASAGAQPAGSGRIALEPYSPEPAAARPTAYMPPGTDPFPPAGTVREAPPARTFSYGSLRYLGKALSCYLVCEDGDALVLVDMHAAHERINFNRIRRSLMNGERLQVQRLLLPMTIEVRSLGIERVEAHREILEALGVEWRREGEQTLAVLAYPTVFSAAGVKGIFEELASNEWETVSFLETAQRIESVAARIACHASIRSGETLNDSEARALLVELDEAELSTACPHGRPCAVRVTHHEIEKIFGRR